MNELCKSQFQGSYLQHHGVLGMKWGVRRYQPYGEGGYDPKNKGKFVGGEKQQKRLLKYLKKVAKDPKGYRNPENRHRNVLLNDEGLRKTIANNKELMKAVKNNNKAYDRYIEKFNERKESPELFSDADKEEIFKRYEQWVEAGFHKKEQIEKTLDLLLGNHRFDTVYEIKLKGGKEIRNGSNTLWNIVDQIANETDRAQNKVDYGEKDTELEDMIRMDKLDKKSKK